MHPFDGIVILKRTKVSLNEEAKAAGDSSERDWAFDYSGADIEAVCDLAAQTLVIQQAGKFRRNSGEGFSASGDTFKVVDLIDRKRTPEDPETKALRLKLAKLRRTNPAKYAELAELLEATEGTTDPDEPVIAADEVEIE